MSSVNVEYWGELPPVEGTTQLTRSMSDMKFPRPYIIENGREEVLCDEIDKKVYLGPTCSYMMDTVKILEYIKEAESHISEMSEGRICVSPVYPNLMSPLTETKYSTTSNITPRHFFQQEYDLHPTSVDYPTKKGVCMLALHKGYDLANLSAINLLVDATKQFLEGISSSLRKVLDTEALSGRTGFYDCIDQVLHDNDLSGIDTIVQFYKSDVINYYKVLKAKGTTLRNHLNSEKSKPTKVKDETSSSKQSGWIPVKNTSGESVSTVIASTKPQWMPFVKIEPFNQLQAEQLYATSSFRPISPTRDENNRPMRKKIKK
ncbi:STAGA complex 65 subunit gamma isoform X2 [Ciona intestinalis]